MTVNFDPYDRNPDRDPERNDRRQPDYRRWKLFERNDDDKWEAKAPYGSVDAGYFLRGGRYFGCGITLLILLFPLVILLYGLYAISQEAINYELAWLPLSTLQCGTALAIFVFAPLLPFRLWMLFTAINKDNEDTQQEKPMPTQARLYKDEWEGWGKQETRAYLKSRQKGEGAGYLVMVGLFDESGAMRRLIKSLSKLKYTLSDDEEKQVYEAEREFVDLMLSHDWRKKFQAWKQKYPKLKDLHESKKHSPLHLMLLVEDKEEEVIAGKVEKAMGRKQEDKKLELPKFVPGCFWFFSALTRLLFYIFVPIVIFKWLSERASRQNFGDPQEFSRSRDNGDAEPTPKPRKVPITTHQAAVLEILKLPPEKRNRFIIARVPKPGFDRYLGKSEPQTKPRALNFGLYHQFSKAKHEAVRFECIELPERSLGYLLGFDGHLKGKPGEGENVTDLPRDNDLSTDDELRARIWSHLNGKQPTDIVTLISLYEAVWSAERKYGWWNFEFSGTEYGLLDNDIVDLDYALETYIYRWLDRDDLSNVIAHKLGFALPEAFPELLALRAVLQAIKPTNAPGSRYKLAFHSRTGVYSRAERDTILTLLDFFIHYKGIRLFHYIRGSAGNEDFDPVKQVIEAAFGVAVVDEACAAYENLIQYRQGREPQEWYRRKKLQYKFYSAMRKFYESSFAQGIWGKLFEEVRESRPLPVWRDYRVEPRQIRYTVVYDAEDRPEEDQLLKAVREYKADRVLLEKLRVKAVVSVMELIFAPRVTSPDERTFVAVHGEAFDVGLRRLKKRLLDAHAAEGLDLLRFIGEEHDALRRLIQRNLRDVHPNNYASTIYKYLPYDFIPYDFTFETYLSGDADEVARKDPEMQLQNFLAGSPTTISPSYPPFLRTFLKQFDFLLNNPEIHEIRYQRLGQLTRWLLRTIKDRTVRRDVIRHAKALDDAFSRLNKVVGDLEQSTVCFQAKLTYENLNDNWVISIFKADYASWFNYLLPGLHRNRMAIPLGGTSNHFQVKFLQYVGGWDAYNVAEDCDLGMWIARNDKQVRVLNSITWEVANDDITKWVGQRSRWIKGYAQSYFVHMRRPLLLLNDLGWRRFWGFQFTVGAGFLMPMLSPFFYVMTFIYLISLVLIIVVGFASTDGTLEAAKIPLRFIYDIHYYWILPFGTGSFFIANIIYFLILVIGQLRHPKPGNMRWIVSWWWLYWIFMNAAAFRALWEYIFDPHSWDKSDHSYL